MSDTDRTRWDEKYRLKSELPSPVPSEWLRSVVTDLPPGRAWDVACGVGQNAHLLAQLGWTVDAVDISPIGLEIGSRSSENHPENNHCGNIHSGKIHWIAADLDTYAPSPDTYNLVIVFRFLDRLRLPQIIQNSLKPGGRIVYETFVAGQMSRSDNHLTNPDFVLKSGELPTLFPELRTLAYTEESLTDRTVARWVGIKPE